MALIYHDVGYQLRLRFLLLMGGVGVITQTPVVFLRRRSDNAYFKGNGWQAGPFALVMTEEDDVAAPGSYFYDFDSSFLGADEIHAYFRNIALPPLNLTDDETHVFKPNGGGGSSIGAERRLSASMAENGGQYQLALWIEESGQRVIDYDSMTAQVVDIDGNLIINLGTKNLDNVDGVFGYVTPSAPLAYGQPYILRVSATRGLTTDRFNMGFTRV